MSERPGTWAMFLAAAMSAIRQARQAGRVLLGLGLAWTLFAQGAVTAFGQTAPTRRGFQQPGAPASGPAPFLTEAISWELDKFAKFSEQLVYPTKVKTDAPFCDVPFAVNVPFEVPFDGGAVRVFFDVNIVWDEPERKTVYNPPGSSPRPLFPENGGGWNFYQQGIYRLDGGALSDATAVWEVDSSESRPMTWQTAAPFPLLLNGAPPTPARGGSVTTRVDVNSPVATPKPRRPFTNARDEPGGFAAGRPLVLRSAAPGWYALWFTLSPSLWAWPPKPLRADDTLRAKIFVHYIVARRERFNGTGGYFYPVDLEVLWTGADKKPVVPIDPNLVRAHTVEIPLTLRRDGWVLVRADADRVSERNSWLDLKLPPRESRERVGVEVTGQVMLKAYGVTANYQSSIFERANTDDPFPRTPTRATKMTWEVTLPSEIPDGGVGQIVATGGVERQGGDAKFRDRKPHEYNEDYVYRWLNRPDKPKPDPHNVGSLLELVRSDDPGDKAGYVKDWGWKVGDPDGSRFWKLGGNGAPPRARDDQRYTIIAQPPKPEAANTWTKELLPILYQDLGPQHLFSVDVGPWRVKGYYRRKKDADKIVSGTPTIGAAKVADEKDEFWEWYPKYSRFLREKLGEIGKLETEIAIERELWQQQRRTARVLLDAYQSAQDPGSWTDWFASSHTKAEFSEAMLARLVRSAGQANKAAFTHLGAIRDRIARIRQAHEAIIAELDRVLVRHIVRHPELTLWRRHQRALLEASDFKNALGTGDPGLFQAAMARANLQPDSLQPAALVAMAQLQLENGDTMGAVQALRSATRQDPANEDARRRLRDVECSLIKVALEKSQGAIAQARKHFYGYLKERGYGERDHAVAARVVQVRSPLVDHLPGIDNGAWVAEVRAPGLARYDAESAWAVFTTGVTGAVSGLLGRAEQEARALDATERDMTVAFLGAHAILRLRMRGHTLEEIKALTTSQIQEEIARGAPNAPAMKRERAQELGLAIHRAFQLPELVALLSEDAQALRKGLAQGYWNERDVGNTWAEWVGDVTSPKNLVMMLLPMSVARVGGQAAGIAYWTRAEAAFVQGATRTAYVDTGTMVVARMLQMDRALGAIGATKGGEAFIQLLERSQHYQESLGLFGQAGWTLGKMVAVMALQGLALHAAEELGGPHAALAVEAMLLFGGDTDLLIKFLDGARISRQSARLALDRFVVTAERQQWELQAIRRRMVDIEHDVVALQKGKTPPPRSRESVLPSSGEGRPGAVAGSKTTPVKAGGTGSGTGAPGTPSPGSKTNPVRPGSTGSGTGAPGTGAPADGVVNDAVGGARTAGNPLDDPRPVIPNGQPGNDIINPIRGAGDGLDQGSINGASQAGEALANDLDDEIRALGQKIQEARGLAGKLDAPPTPPPPRPLATGKFSSSEAGNYRYPPHPGTNRTWVEAEQALSEGDFAAAEESLMAMKSQLARDVSAGRPISPHELPLELLERKIAQARALKTTPKPVINRALAKQVTEAIPEAEVEKILQMKRVPLPADDLGAAGLMSFAGDRFMVKELAPGQGKLIKDSEDLLWAVEAELVGGEIARSLGTPTPGVNAKVKWRMGDRGPEMESAELVYRRVIATTESGEVVRGTSLHKMTDAELFHCREQIADQRAGSILAGDYDRKPDNFMELGGVVFQLDCGQADVRAEKALRAFGAKDAPITVGGAWGNDHWWKNAFDGLAQPRPDKLKIQQIFLSESALTYEHAAPGLQRIRDRFNNPAQLEELRESIRNAYRTLYRDSPRFKGRDPRLLEFEVNGKTDDVIAALRARLPAVEEAIKDLHIRTGRPRPSAWVAPRHRRGLTVPFPSNERIAA